jgi:hypothetical protein
MDPPSLPTRAHTCLRLRWMSCYPPVSLRNAHLAADWLSWLLNRLFAQDA